MKRVHLFEFGDKNWFPQFLRDMETDFLEFGANQFNIYKGIEPLLAKGLEKAGAQKIIDLGSGGGGGWPAIIKNLLKAGTSFKLKLTDINPNLPAFEKMQAKFPAVVEYSSQSIDATQVPPREKGLRTMFLSFHHLQPDMATAVLRNAVEANEPMAVFELQDRSLPSLLAMFVFAPLNAIITAPFTKPFKLTRLFFTFILPILPLVIWWDGVVSNLRTYNEKELRQLCQKADPEQRYHWQIEKIKKGPGFILYLLGTKK
ncbi:hypothetical protein GC194_12075 [bacterium]|nr:hypothetical protein [bacterium]